MEELGLPALTGMAAALVAFTVSAIDAFKVYILKGWAARVPAVVWYLMAIGIPTGICIWLGLDWFNAVTGEQIPANLEPYSAAATGVIVGIGASGSYKAKETAKAIKAESMKAEGKAVPPYLTPPGEPGVPAPVSQNGDISNTGNTPGEETLTGRSERVQDMDTSPERVQDTSQNGNRNSPVDDSTSRLSVETPNLSVSDRKDVSNFTQYVEHPATYPAEMTSGVINVVSSPMAYLLNQCDTDPDIGPHFVLADGRLYRVDHGSFEYLPNGWTETLNKGDSC